MDEALNYARIHNYDLNAAKHNLKAKKYDVKTNQGDCLLYTSDAADEL